MRELHINARFLVQPLSGTQRYAHQLLEVLGGQVLGWPELPKITAWVPEGDFTTPNWDGIEVRRVGRHSGHLWEQIDLARAARHGWLLNLISSGPILHPRQIITFHDAAVFDHPENFSRKYAFLHGSIRPLLARRARKIITVSEFSRRALARAMKLPEENFSIVPNGADHLLRVAPDEGTMARRGLTPQGYVLFVGNEAPHKNVSTALKAFVAMRDTGLQFVTVGVGLSNVFGKLELGGNSSVSRLTDVADGELRALYENAALLIFPSRYEGFGIPPLEAMSLGCPVVASTAAAIPEIVGDAAFLVDPDDVEGMTAAMASVVNDQALRKDLIRKGHARAATFRWIDAGAKLARVLCGLLGGAAR